MTEQEEAVGRQRLAVLVQHQKRLISLETERDVDFAEGHPRHDQAVADYDMHAALVGRFETDPFIPPVRLKDAEQAVTGATEQLAAADKALATHTTEAAKQLATHQAAVEKATTDFTEAQSALDALKT